MRTRQHAVPAQSCSLRLPSSQRSVLRALAAGAKILGGALSVLRKPNGAVPDVLLRRLGHVAESSSSNARSARLADHEPMNRPHRLHLVVHATGEKYHVRKVPFNRQIENCCKPLRALSSQPVIRPTSQSVAVVRKTCKLYSSMLMLLAGPLDPAALPVWR